MEQDVDVYKAIQRAKAKWEHQATFPLHVGWCRDEMRLVFGCKTCMQALAKGHITMPLRYKDPHKSKSFAHCNLEARHISLAIKRHSASKVHRKAEKAAAEAGDNAGNPDDEEAKIKPEEKERCAMLLNHMYVAVRSLVKLKPAEQACQSREPCVTRRVERQPLLRKFPSNLWPFIMTCTVVVGQALQNSWDRPTKMFGTSPLLGHAFQLKPREPCVKRRVLMPIPGGALAIERTSTK